MYVAGHCLEAFLPGSEFLLPPDGGDGWISITSIESTTSACWLWNENISRHSKISSAEYSRATANSNEMGALLEE
jgi:hypothetical protein